MRFITLFIAVMFFKLQYAVEFSELMKNYGQFFSWVMVISLVVDIGDVINSYFKG